jgi:hypothetical protein
MSLETKPRIELLFQDVEDIFLQDLEDPFIEDPYPQYAQELLRETNNIQQILDKIMLSLPYICIGYLLLGYIYGL